MMLCVGLQMWPSLIQKAREGGLDAIQTYVFWNVHEPLQGQVGRPPPLPIPWIRFLGGLEYLGSSSDAVLVVDRRLQYDFEGRYDLVRFVKEIQAQGLYVSLRIGPFIESEWKYG